jgi:hypothetical protein
MPHRQNHTRVLHFCPSAQDLFPSGIQNGCVPRATCVPRQRPCRRRLDCPGNTCVPIRDVVPPSRNTAADLWPAVICPRQLKGFCQGVSPPVVSPLSMPRPQNHAKVLHFFSNTQDLCPSGIRQACVPRADGVSTTRKHLCPLPQCLQRVHAIHHNWCVPSRYAANRYLRCWCVPTE